MFLRFRAFRFAVWGICVGYLAFGFVWLACVIPATYINNDRNEYSHDYLPSLIKFARIDIALLFPILASPTAVNTLIGAGRRLMQSIACVFTSISFDSPLFTWELSFSCHFRVWK